jgi:hypothetical protein
VAETIGSELAFYCLWSARDIDAQAENGEAEATLTSWICRLKRAGVRDLDFLRLTTEEWG